MKFSFFKICWFFKKLEFWFWKTSERKNFDFLRFFESHFFCFKFASFQKLLQRAAAATLRTSFFALAGIVRFVVWKKRLKVDSSYNCTWETLSRQKMHRKTFSRKSDAVQRHVVVQKSTLNFFSFFGSLHWFQKYLKNESENVSALDFVIVPFFGPVFEHVTRYFSYRRL